jgi:hypothetical protein
MNDVENQKSSEKFMGQRMKMVPGNKNESR